MRTISAGASRAPRTERRSPAGQLGMEAGPRLEQAANPPQPRSRPVVGRVTREDLQQRALAGAVAADHADDVAALDFELDPAQRPELEGEERAEALLRRRKAARRCRPASRGPRRAGSTHRAGSAFPGSWRRRRVPDDVRNGVLHSPKQPDAGEQDGDRDRDRDRDGGQLQMGTAEQAASKALHGRHHGIHRETTLHSSGTMLDG